MYQIYLAYIGVLHHTYNKHNTTNLALSVDNLYSVQIQTKCTVLQYKML